MDVSVGTHVSIDYGINRKGFQTGVKRSGDLEGGQGVRNPLDLE